jgi:hypothetical protein
LLHERRWSWEKRDCCKSIVHFYIKEGKEGLGEKEGDVENEWE